MRTNFKEASALGAAITTAASLEWKNGLREIANSLIKVEKTFEPNEDESKFYHHSYHKYLDLRNRHINKNE
jgi:sugar (pentulose or hexulose) kinase